MTKKRNEARRNYYLDYSASSLDAARGWRESASHARKMGDSKAAKLFAEAARKAARRAREYKAQAFGRKHIFSRSRRSR